MTIEDFAHRCLLIKAGNAELAIPCCANCRNYAKSETWDGYECWACKRIGHLELYTKPEEFCSRFEERKKPMKNEYGIIRKDKNENKRRG